MKFIIFGGFPYYYDGDSIHPCTISAKEITVDFDVSLPVPDTITCVYSDNEICMPFGIRLVDAWDGRSNKAYKKSNKSIKSTEKTYSDTLKNMPEPEMPENPEPEEPEPENPEPQGTAAGPVY